MTNPLILKAGGRLFRFHYGEWDRPLFIALGAALAEAQSLEFQLAHMLGLASTANEERLTAELTEDFLSRTLGYLARKIREYAPDDHTATVLDDLVETRNYVVHRCLRDYGWPMSSIDEYQKAVHELDDIRTLLRDGGDTIILAIQKAKDLDIILVRTNPETGKPQVVN
ncbi:MAG TPA: hypothetical protein VF982_05085 [Anaerolineales bacterium]|jgi:hypothetical protein